MQKIWNISRPRFWVYTLGPFWLCAPLFYPFNKELVPFFIMLVYFTFPANILIYGINDLYDTSTDVLNDKKKSYEKLFDMGDKKNLLFWIFFSNIFFVIYAIFSLSQSALFYLFLFICISWQYSAPPIRAKAKPFFDSFFSGLLYILPALVSWKILSHSGAPFLPFLAAFFWSFAMHVYSAIPDIAADTKAHIKTSATILGKNKTIIFCGLLYGAATFIAYQYIGFVAPALYFVYLVLLIFSYNKNTPEEVLSVYKIFPIINTISGIILFITFYFIKAH